MQQQHSPRPFRLPSGPTTYSASSAAAFLYVPSRKAAASKQTLGPGIGIDSCIDPGPPPLEVKNQEPIHF